jgi:hypothetical protein
MTLYAIRHIPTGKFLNLYADIHTSETPAVNSRQSRVILEAEGCLSVGLHSRYVLLVVDDRSILHDLIETGHACDFKYNNMYLDLNFQKEDLEIVELDQR